MNKLLIFLFWIVFASFFFQGSSIENTMSEKNNNAVATIDLLADPEFKSFIDKFSKHWKSVSHLSLDEQRKLDADFFREQNTCLEPIHHIENIEILGNDNNKIPLRIYIPNNSKKLPIMTYFHGGGWVFGGIEE